MSIESLEIAHSDSNSGIAAISSQLKNLQEVQNAASVKRHSVDHEMMEHIDVFEK